MFPRRTGPCWLCDSITLCLMDPQTLPPLPLLFPLPVLFAVAMSNGGPAVSVGLTVFLFSFFLWGPARTQYYLSSFTCHTSSPLSLRLTLLWAQRCWWGAQRAALSRVPGASPYRLRAPGGQGSPSQPPVPGAWCVRCCRL